MIRIGLCTEVANAGIVADCGLDFIEENIQRLLVPRADSAAFAANLALVKSSPLPVIAANAFLPGDLKCVGPDVDWDGLMHYGAVAFARAQQVGIRTMVIGSGASRQVPAGWSATAADEQFSELLRHYGPLADNHGVTIVVEALNRGECNYINSLAEGAAIVKAVAHPAVQLLTDIYHMLREDEPASEITAHAAMIRHAHIAERAERTAPGIAGDDFSAYFKALSQMDYRGAIAIEARMGPDLKAETTRAVQTIRAAWEQAQRP
jgi:sugar phosphate isomerase/epimerase